MFEQTNQTNASEEGFCDDVFEKAIAEEASEQEQTVSAELTDVPETPTPQTYTVKYNGKEVQLTLDELKTRAQMGLNYDHVKSENDRIKNSPLYKSLHSMAQREGISMEACASRLLENRSASAISALQARGMDAADARQFYDMQLRLASADAERVQSAPYLAFVRKFPEVAHEEIAPQVWERFWQTGDLVGAYTEVENERLRAQISAMQQNDKNAKARIGSLANTAANAHTDPFLEGLLG